MKVLLLHSVDGPDYCHPVMYDCSEADVDRLAVEAFEAAKAANPDEWSWDDIVSELEKRGFVIPLCHDGPTWDE